MFEGARLFRSSFELPSADCRLTKPSANLSSTRVCDMFTD
jgi:hypothetical protein